MLAHLVNNRHYFDFNQCKSQKIVKKSIQNPTSRAISRVKLAAEYVLGTKKYKAIDNKRGKAVKVCFHEK